MLAYIYLGFGSITDYGHPERVFFSNIPNFWAWADKLGYLGLGFEFGPQRLRNLAFVCL